MRIWVKPVGKGMFFGCIEGVPWGVGPSSAPLLDAARIALQLGHDPAEVIELWHEGASEWALRSTVGEAAKLRVNEDRTRFTKYAPFPAAGIGAKADG